MTNMGSFAASRRAGEFKVRIMTLDLVIEGVVVTMKEKPRLSDHMKDPKPFLNVTKFEAFSKAVWLASAGSGVKPVPVEKADYVAIGKSQIEMVTVLDPGVDPDKG